MDPLIVFGLYYAFGFAWLCSGIYSGWLRWEGEPATVTMWIGGMAMIWPWLMIRILYDYYVRGNEWTEL